MFSSKGITLALSFLVLAAAQYHNFGEHLINQVTWCTINQEEQYKCGNLSVQLERDRALFDDKYLEVKCHQADDLDECMHLIDADKANVMTLDPGEMFRAGRYSSLVPIMQEAYEGGLKTYYSVAVVKMGTLPDVHGLHDLRGKKACFAYVGSQAGWTVPVNILQKNGGMKIVDCNNHVKSASEYFGPSCAVYALYNKYNPIGDNSDSLCEICTGPVPGGRCTPQDPYFGFEGAFRCLLEEGDVAFLKHTTVQEMVESKAFKSVTADRFELLCLDGSRRPIEEYRTCNWGTVPSHALVISSAKTPKERRQYQRFFTELVEMYSSKSKSSSAFTYNTTTPRYQQSFGNRNSYDSYNPNDRFQPQNRDRFDSNRDRFDSNRDRFDSNRFDNNNRFDRRYEGSETTSRRPYENSFDNETRLYEKFELFDSSRFGKKLNLLFQDATRSLVSIEEDNQNYAHYLGRALEEILEVRSCPVGRMTLCVTSDAEFDKCIRMKTALKSQLIKPEMVCYKAHSHINCMQAISSGVADVAVFDAADIYTAGLRYGLVPFIAEVHDLGQPEYYVVAVAREEDPDTELTYLKYKNTCHPGVNTAAGWVYPMAYLIANGWIRPYGCDAMRAAAEYFTKSCLPGALSTEYNTGVPYDNMCDLCHGASFRYCRRDASEDYYGHTGAFRCLVEGGGDVAFIKHSTVDENTGGKRREWWARDMLLDDFELLCPDGTRAEVNEYERCNLGRVKTNAIVTRGGDAINQTQVNAYINLFQYAQQLFGRKDTDDFSFSLFYTKPPYYDLIFQDTTRQLRVLDKDQRRFDTYLGPDFMRAKRITDCYAGAASIGASLMLLAVSALVSLL